MTTGWPPGLIQDDSRKLSDWFASRVDARWTVRQVCAEIERNRMTTTPLPPPDTHYFDEDTNMDVWSYSAGLVQQHVADLAEENQHLETMNAQLREQNTTLDAACAKLEAENANLKRDAEMHEAIRAGDSVLLNEQAALLRECRLALDELLKKKPMLAAIQCGSTTLGNLRASLYDHRPQGVFGGTEVENTK